MKKIAIYYFSLAAIVGGSLASCQEADLGFSAEEIAQAKFEKEYQENFERDYGKIAPGHTWGFDAKVMTRSNTAPTRYKLEHCFDDTGVNYTENHNVQLPDGSWDNGTVTWKCRPAFMYQEGGGTEDFDERNYAGLNYPGHVSQAEKEYVFYYLRTHPDKGITTCPLDNYFMQDLHQDPFPSPAANENSATEHCPGWGYMNNLYFDNNHFQDFNGTQYSPDYYVVHTNVVNPSYQDSYGTNGNPSLAVTRYNRYRYYYIPPFTGTIPADQTSTGNAITIDYPGGFYLCFDYESYKEIDGNKEYCPFGHPDKIYNDWVIKLTAGQYDTHRVFCEDLGSTFDLDFNDLVFDYVYYGPGIEVKVLALVGTLPISMSYNTQVENIKTSNTIQESVNKTYFFSGASDIKSIEIAVSTVGRGTCWMKNVEGKAPYMIQVPAGTAWPAEHQRIENKYPDFSKYVTNPQEQPFFWGEFNKYPIYNPNN